MASAPRNDELRALVWRTLCALTDHRTPFYLTFVTAIVGNPHRRMIEKALAFLSEEGLVIPAPGGQQLRPGLRSTTVPIWGEPGSRARQKQRQLWAAMRGMGRFTAQDVALHASTDSLAIDRFDAASYIGKLAAAGVLSPLGDGASWRLVPARNSGPRAPLPDRLTGGVFDFNTMTALNVTETPASNRRRAA